MFEKQKPLAYSDIVNIFIQLCQCHVNHMCWKVQLFSDIFSWLRIIEDLFDYFNWNNKEYDKPQTSIP